MNCASCGAVNPSGARFCQMCGEQLQGAGSRERRRVSVVFIDLTAFTTLTLGFDPEELRDLANEVLTVVAGVIEDYDGYVDAFRGDGLIALFGAPRSHPDDPQRAVLAASAGLRAIETIGRSKGFPLKGRAGVNSGVVIAGSVGSGRVRDYTVMGSTVNLAARLEAAAIPGEVWVGPETYEATRHRLVYEPSPTIRLAGFPKVRHAYRLVSSLEQYDHDPYTYLQFVARERELAQLYAALRTAREAGRVQGRWLVGEAGVGKTRLLREFARGASGSGTQVIWVGGNPSDSSGWQQLATQILGLQEGEETRVRQQRAVHALQTLLPDAHESHRAILASLGLAPVAGAGSSPNGGRGNSAGNGGSVPSGGSRAGSGGSAGRQTAVDAWRDLVTAATRRHGEGTVLVVDSRANDVLMRRLSSALEGTEAPLLVLRTARPDDVEALPEGQSLRLGPFGEEDSKTLVRQLVDPSLLEATSSLIVQVGGVPAYLLELGRALSTTREGGFSGSLASLLQARLDLLSPQGRQLLSIAALCGERSWELLLLELSGLGEDELRRLLRESLLVTEPSSQIPDQVAYRFQSELLRHAVLRMIPFGDRPVLHLQIANWLEQHAPLALAELTAFHFAEGGNAEAAYPHYLAAADLVASQRDERFVELYRKLLALELPPELRAQGALAFTQALADGGQVEAALEQLNVADAALAECTGTEREELSAAREQLAEELASGSVSGRTPA